MGFLVELITTCFYDIVPFAVYLFIWIIAFTLSYKILGVDIKTTELSHLTKGGFMSYFFQVWDNSVGNIHYPQIDSKTQQTDERIFYIYSVWFLTQFIVLIILLNFIIAVISQSYENVMNSKIVLNFSGKQ